jgi:hypothetical protein
MQNYLYAKQFWLMMRAHKQTTLNQNTNMKTLTQTESILSRKFLTSTEEDTLARFIANQSFNRFGMTADALTAAFEHVASWSPAVCLYDAPVRQAKLSTAASGRVKRFAVKYVREWSTRREQGAN